MSGLLFRKEVDWSLLNTGITIPVENQELLLGNLGEKLNRGDTRDIEIIIKDVSYSAKIYNVNFSEKHQREKDTFQIIYSLKSDLAVELRQCFTKSYQYLFEMREKREIEDTHFIKVPDNQKEYLLLYTTDEFDQFLAVVENEQTESDGYGEMIKNIAGKGQVEVNNQNNLVDPYIRAARAMRDFVNSTELKYNPDENELKPLYDAFRSRFSPEVLLKIPDEKLLESLFFKAVGTNDCMCYWLEFNPKIRENFGSIAGGTAFKYNLFQRKTDNAWVTGSPSKPVVLSEVEALKQGKEIRDYLVHGAEIIDSFPELKTLEAYEDLDAQLSNTIGKYASLTWVHKYFHMIFPDKFATFHSKDWQKHFIYALGIKPSEKYYGCSGQLAIIAKYAELIAPVFSYASYQQFGEIRHFMRIATNGGEENDFAIWERDGFAAMGWGSIGPLNDYIENGKINKTAIIEKLQETYYTTVEHMASKKAGELIPFYNTTSDTIFVAMDGETLLALGDEVGGYLYNEDTEFAHRKPVKWHSCFQEDESLPNKKEGLTSTCNLFSDSDNLLYLYRKYYHELDKTGEIIIDGGDEKTEIKPERKPRSDCLHPLNQIIYGPPGTGKTYSTVEYALAIIEKRLINMVPQNNDERKRLMELYRNYVEKGQIIFTTFHQSYGYEEFIQGIRPDSEAGTVCFKKVNGIFKKIADKALEDPDNNYVMIIDEINRGNISKVFGELITLIEEDKRCGELNQLTVTLPLGDSFTVPNNLYIIGTMNTADKSISLIDTALRRRFSFIEMAPDVSVVEDAVMRNVLTEMNNYLKKELRSNDLLIGHAFFVGKKESDLGNIMNRSIVPLLYEYFYDDEAKVKKALDCLIGTAYELDDQYSGRIRIQKKV